MAECPSARPTLADAIDMLGQVWHEWRMLKCRDAEAQYASSAAPLYVPEAVVRVMCAVQGDTCLLSQRVRLP